MLMKPDIEKLREKYMNNPPEGMTSADIRYMSEEELLDMDYFLNEDIWIFLCDEIALPEIRKSDVRKWKSSTRVYSRSVLSKPYTSRIDLSCSASMLVMLI